MIGLGSYAKVNNTKLLVEVISSVYTQENDLYVDVRLVFDPMITFTVSVDKLELVIE